MAAKWHFMHRYEEFLSMKSAKIHRKNGAKFEDKAGIVQTWIERVGENSIKDKISS